MPKRLKRIIIVDDDEEICEEMGGVLRDEGYDVECVFNGSDGRSLIEKNNYDLALLDVKMPGMTGLEILQCAKEKGVKTPVIILTGSLMVDRFLKHEPLSVSAKEAISLKLADAVMTKPFDPQVVLNKIKELVG